MEFHAVAQPKAPAIRLLLFPAERQARRQAQFLGAADQHVIDLLQHHGDGAHILAMRVERIGVARGSPAHRSRIRIRPAKREPAGKHGGP